MENLNNTSNPPKKSKLILKIANTQLEEERDQ